jgi:hypothetical protein
MNTKTGESGSADKPFFLVALNLPHAGRIARRILPLLPLRGQKGSGPDADAAHKIAVELTDLLDPCLESDDNPPGPASARLQQRAAALGRVLVDHIERGRFGHDRLGQCVRNLFECLELGREGADISLRAGENPKSLQRPM